MPLSASWRGGREDKQEQQEQEQQLQTATTTMPKQIHRRSLQLRSASEVRARRGTENISREMPVEEETRHADPRASELTATVAPGDQDAQSSLSILPPDVQDSLLQLASDMHPV